MPRNGEPQTEHRYSTAGAVLFHFRRHRTARGHACWRGLLRGYPGWVGNMWWFAAGLAAMTVLAIVVQRHAGVRLGMQPLVAVIRAAVQLAVIALILRGVLAVPWLVLAFVALMLTTASWTSFSRLRGIPGARQAVVTGVFTGALVTIGLIFGMRLVEFEVTNVVAVAGIVIGNTMSAATLTGRNFERSTVARRGEIEAWLSLGATSRVAYQAVAQESMKESLIPNIDQTRATGLVTLPGAFVGALLGGASPAQAAMLQLVGILLTQSICSSVVLRVLSGSPEVPQEVRKL